MQSGRLPVTLPSVSPEDISEEDVEEARSELKLTSLSSKRLSAHRVLGAHLAKIGVVNVARGYYLFNIEQLQEAVTLISGLVAEYDGDGGTQAKLLATQVQMLRAIKESTDGLINSGEVEKEQLPPGAGLGKVTRPTATVNISTSGPTTITATEQ